MPASWKRSLICVLLMLSLPSGRVSWAADDGTEAQLGQVDRSIRLRQYPQAVKLLEPLVARKDAEAQFRLAGLYRSGRGVTKDLDKALALYREAANSGHAEAQYTLAALMEKQASRQFSESEIGYWYRAAAAQGHRKAIAKLKKISVSNHQLTDPELFFSAIRSNDGDKVRKFLEGGMSPDLADAQGRTPLMVALLAGHREMASMLLPLTGDLDHADREANRALHFATMEGFGELVGELIDNKVDIDAQDRLGNTALILAARHRHLDIIDRLLRAGANHRLSNRKKLTAVEIAHNLDNKRMIAVFKKYKISYASRHKPSTDIDLKSFQRTVRESDNLYNGWPPLAIASVLGDEHIVKQLLQKRPDVNARDREGYTSLHRAASKGHSSIVDLLLAKGASPDAQNKNDETALFKAAESGHVETVKLLLKKGANPALVASNKHSALSVAIINGHQQVAEQLLHRSLDAESLHRSLLHAIQKGLPAVALALIKKDKLINELDEHERNLLWYSADLGQARVTERLLQDGRIKIDHAGRNGYTPLARAVLKGHHGVAALLLKHGADATTRTGEQNTLLMLAVLSGNKGLTNQMINAGIAIDARNSAGDTALMLAAGMGRDDIIEQLIGAGADLQLRNHDELNAYEIARNAGHDQTASLIRERSGRLFKLFN